MISYQVEILPPKLVLVPPSIVSPIGCSRNFYDQPRLDGKSYMKQTYDKKLGIIYDTYDYAI